MARKIGGRYSPGGRSGGQGGGPATSAPVDWSKAKPTPAGAMVNALFFLPVPFAVRAFWAEPTGLALNLAAFALLILAAWLTREGVIAHAAYNARRVARRPAIPRKIFGAVLTGAGLAVGGITGGIVPAAIFAVLGAALHLAAFGPDPLRDKTPDGIDSAQSDRVARAVDEAEAHLRAMRERLVKLGDRQLLAQLDAFQTNARALFRTVENDPRTLSTARRYLGVYLLGARDATDRFADLWARNPDAQARDDYAALLADLDSNFAARQQALLTADRTALDIELEVLRDRLAREGVRPE